MGNNTSSTRGSVRPSALRCCRRCCRAEARQPREEGLDRGLLDRPLSGAASAIRATVQGEVGAQDDGTTRPLPGPESPSRATVQGEAAQDDGTTRPLPGPESASRATVQGEVGAQEDATTTLLTGPESASRATVQGEDDGIARLLPGPESTSRATVQGEAGAQDPVDLQLANKGFTVRQLLQFYIEKGIAMETTTEQVVRDIVIPETAAEKTYYMDSNFMRQRGGPQEAHKLVSHAWNSRFSTTVLNILIDAADVSLDALKEQLKEHVLGIRFFSKALQCLDTGILESTYWLCILAINEHFAICGTCWKCKLSTSEQFRLPICNCWDKDRCFYKVKYNPCRCGALKHKPEDPAYEINKFPLVVSRMSGGLVVSLDESLETLTRVWVVAEVVEAIKSQPVTFRAVHGFSEEKQQQLMNGKQVVLPVAECRASDENDKAMILGRIADKEAFDDLVRTCVEVGFGKCSRLCHLSQEAEDYFARLNSLVIDCKWNRDLRATADLNLGKNFHVFQNLRTLDISFQALAQLTDVGSLTEGLSELRHLVKLRLDFSRCEVLEFIPGLRQGLAGLEALLHLSIDFSHCWKLEDVNGLRHSLPKLQALKHITLNFAQCVTLADISGLREGLAGLPKLKQLKLVFSGCDALGDLSSLHEGLAGLTALRQLDLDLGSCWSLDDTSWLGRGLAELQDLQQLKLVFKECEALANISELCRGLARLQALQQLDVDFSYCSALVDISGLGKVLSSLSVLADIRLNFGGCPTLTRGIAEVASGVGEMQSLRRMDVFFHDCPGFTRPHNEKWRHKLENLRGNGLVEHLFLDLEQCIDLPESVQATPRARRATPRATRATPRATMGDAEGNEGNEGDEGDEDTDENADDDDVAEFLKEYDIHEKCSEGAYSKVYKARCVRTGSLVSIQKVRILFEEDGVPSTMLREFAILKEACHVNVVCLYEVFCSRRDMHLVYERLDCDLRAYLTEFGSLQDAPLKTAAFQCVRGIEYCHSRGVLHRRLQPQNVLVDLETMRLALTDVGLGRISVVLPSRYPTQDEAVTLWYRAPEMLIGKVRYTPPMDIWSLGCIFPEMATGHALFPGDSEIDTICKIFRMLGTPSEDVWPGVSTLQDYEERFPQWQATDFEDVRRVAGRGFGDAGVDLMRQCLKYNSVDRSSAKALLRHEFFEGVDASNLHA